MDPKETGKAYDQIAENWRDETFTNTNGIEQHQRAIAFLDHAVANNRRIALDVGCGCNSRFHKLLRENGFEVEGVDVSEKMLALARTNQPDMTFHHADICEWVIPGKYNLITAWDSIWHIPLAQQKPVLTKLMNALAPKGVLIFTAGGIEEEGEVTNDFMGPMVYHSTLGLPALVHLINQSPCILRHLEFDLHPEPHVFLIVQNL